MSGHRKLQSQSNAAAGEKMRNLYLIGFMGTGKSTIGRLAAQRLGLRFIDSDQMIESEQGKGIPQIFDEKGEPAFRQMERTFIESGHPPEGCLVSCGGGLIVEPGMMELVRSKGPVVCLLARPETVFERVSGNANRPLLQVDDPLAKIREMLAAREPLYRQAGTEVLTDGRSIADVVSHVCRIYRRSK